MILVPTGRPVALLVGLVAVLAAAGCGSEAEGSGAAGAGSVAPAETLTFYRPPSILTGVTAGQVLDRGDLALDPAWAGTGSTVTFVSTTPAGDTVPVTGAMLVPDTAPPPGGYPVVVWAHGTVGLGDPCAPSRYEPFQAAGAKDFLQAGFLVAAPDYEGLGIETETHPYLVGEATGNNVLDAARAAADFGGGTDVVVFGASQGGHATLFARQLAARYAPELNMLGVVAAAPVTDPAAFLLPGRSDENLFPFTAEAILAWSEVYEEPELTDLVVVEDAEAVRLAREEWCTEDLAPPRPLDEIFVAEPTDSAIWQEAVALNTPATDDVDIPVLLTHGDADLFVPVSGTVQLHDDLCAQGEHVVFLRDPSWGHTAAWTLPLTDIVTWTADRFEGRPAPTDCP